MSRPRAETARTPARLGLALFAVTLALGVASCSSDGDAADDSSPDATRADGTPRADAEADAGEAPSSADSASESSDGSPSASEEALPLDPVPSSPDAAAPAGDGCTPVADEGFIPDGTWFGTLRSAGAGAGTFGLDLACFTTGEAADAAAVAEDPAAEIPVPNGYHISDPTDQDTYALIDDGTATVYLLDGDGAELGAPIPGFEAASTAVAALSGEVRVWVVVQAGQTTLIQQQYLP